MEAKDVLNMDWSPISDWSGLPATQIIQTQGKFRKVIFEDGYVSKSDINNFISNIIYDISRKLHIPYEELLPIIAKENTSFYNVLDEYYKYDVNYGYRYFKKNSEELILLENLFYIPNIKISPVQLLLNSYCNLSDDDKIKLKARIEKIDKKSERSKK